MPTKLAPPASPEAMSLLSYLVLSPHAEAPSAEFLKLAQHLSSVERETLLAMAQANHVVVRGLGVYQRVMEQAGATSQASWAESAIAAERARIGTALGHLRSICEAFDDAGLDLTVMKTLDHWPDFGSDIDLYTNASTEEVAALMQRCFGARMEPRSWGDRLAGKWNFALQGMPDPVEFHIRRLGQTGEQLMLASTIPSRSRMLSFDGEVFRVPAASDRLMISTLQRMYRHFYFRICDIVDSATLVNSGIVDFQELRASALRAGIWEGVATYLVIVSDYIQRFDAPALPLPLFVTEAARFNGQIVHVGGSFLRVPILPQSAGLYGTQFAGLLRRGEVKSSVRLGLLPWLATAAAIGHKITGSDKGIW